MLQQPQPSPLGFSPPASGAATTLPANAPASASQTMPRPEALSGQQQNSCPTAAVPAHPLTVWVCGGAALQHLIPRIVLKSSIAC